MLVTQEQFDSLLAWLGSDRESAGRKYEVIRSGLVRIFVSKGFNDAEDLADETINRVTARLPQISGSYIGEPAYYFHGVAKNIIRERVRRKEISGSVKEARFEPVVEIQEDKKEDLDCLDHCLERLPAQKKDLILDYYLHEGHQKIRHHKNMAEQLRITEGAFRSRAHQIRLKLQNCMQQCALRKNGRQCPISHSEISLGHSTPKH